MHSYLLEHRFQVQPETLERVRSLSVRQEKYVYNGVVDLE